MNYWRPILKQRDYFRANTAPRVWARWLPVLPAPSPCKSWRTGSTRRLPFCHIKSFSPFQFLNQRLMLIYFLHFCRNGSTVPLGPASETGILNPEGYTLNYNEFVVYNPNQVRMRYLLKVQFNFLKLWWVLICIFLKMTKTEDVIFAQDNKYYCASGLLFVYFFNVLCNKTITLKSSFPGIILGKVTKAKAELLPSFMSNLLACAFFPSRFVYKCEKQS